jgi:outer membrane protein OmpA-like peptidoglycan-associated protein
MHYFDKLQTSIEFLSGTTLLFDYETEVKMRETIKSKLGETEKKINEIKETNQSIQVRGYCDSDGPSTYNVDLANRRCEAVISALKSMGIEESSIKKVIHGESNPVSNNKTEKGKSLNRRVVVSVQR